MKQLLLRVPGMLAAYRNGKTIFGLVYEGWLADRRRMNDHLLVSHAWDFDKPATRERYNRVLAGVREIAGSPPWGEVLEIGCADGVFTSELGQRCRHVTAVDISTVACERTQERCAGWQNVIVAPLDLQADPLPGEFDLVFAMDVLEFIHGPRRIRATVRKLAGSLRPGGLLVISISRLPNDMREQRWARWLIEGGDNVVAFLDHHYNLSLLRREYYSRYLIAIYRRTA